MFALLFRVLFKWIDFHFFLEPSRIVMMQINFNFNFNSNYTAATAALLLSSHTIEQCAWMLECLSVLLELLSYQLTEELPFQLPSRCRFQSLCHAWKSNQMFKTRPAVSKSSLWKISFNLVFSFIHTGRKIMQIPHTVGINVSKAFWAVCFDQR